MTEPANDAGFGDFGGDEMNQNEEMPAEEPANDMPFEKEPFDAGVDADEESDPKKFIEQLSGKLGQSLRQFSKDQGQPDFELEKFAINSVISATHTAEMDEKDKNDIIKKINKSGEDETQDFGDDNQNDANDGTNFNEPDNGGDDNGEFDFSSSEEPVNEDEFNIYEREDLFLNNPKKNNMFQPGSNDILDEMKPCWKGYKQVGMKDKNGKEVPNCVPVNENMGESNNYMFWQNLKTIHHASGELLEMSHDEVDAMIANGHAWAVDHIATSSDDIEEVYHFMEANLDDSGDYDGETAHGYEDEYGSVEHMMAEGKYDGKPLGKPMKGDVKKFKVYVRNKKGNVIKVNFGDPNMEIKRDNPKRRKSFRARHKCAQAKDRTTPKYWSCKMWSKKPVSKIVEESLNVSKNFSILDKNTIKMKLHEAFNYEEPLVLPAKPKTKPKETPMIQPSRKNKPFLPERETQPNPKAKK
jgi:hypothetical protein